MWSYPTLILTTFQSSRLNTRKIKELMQASWMLKASVPGWHLGTRLPSHIVPPFHRCPESTALAKPNEQRGREGKCGGCRHWEVDWDGDGPLSLAGYGCGWLWPGYVFTRRGKRRSFKCTASSLGIKSQGGKEVICLCHLTAIESTLSFLLQQNVELRYSSGLAVY